MLHFHFFQGPFWGQGAHQIREQTAALLQGPDEEVWRCAEAEQAVHQEGPGGLPDRTREQASDIHQK